MAITVGPWYDRLLDYAHWAGAPNPVWRPRTTSRYGQKPRTEYWLSIRMPGKTHERIAATLESAAFALMQDLAPDPDDLPEP